MTSPFISVRVAKSLSASETTIINLSTIQRIAAKGDNQTMIFFSINDWIIIEEHYGDIIETLKFFNYLK